MTGRFPLPRRRTRAALLLLAIVAGGGRPLAAQQDSGPPPGVDLATRYTLANRQTLAVRPVAGAAVIADVAGEIGRTLETDLRHSDRFEMRPTPASLAAGPVDYGQWNALNLVWLVTADATATPTGFRLQVSVHDVPFGGVRHAGTFTLPTRSSAEFLLTVHAVSDEIVRWLTNQQGAAATRVAFVRHNADGRYDLMQVDADGRELRRIFGSELDIYSPTWSPDGRRLSYTQRQMDGWHLVERDLASGRTRSVHRDANMILTPQYSPDGRRIAFYSWQNGGAEILEMELPSGDIRQVTNSPGDNMYPTYSPDGRRMAFHSTRTGRQHVYVMPVAGGDAVVLSPFAEGVEYAAPDWSPMGNDVVFHGRTRGGRFQIMRADASRAGVRVTQLTSEGENEDPSWAPDGRHIVFAGTGYAGQAPGLYVMDLVTGNRRLLVAGRGLRLADWSGTLLQVGRQAQ